MMTTMKNFILETINTSGNGSCDDSMVYKQVMDSCLKVLRTPYRPYDCIEFMENGNTHLDGDDTDISNITFHFVYLMETLPILSDYYKNTIVNSFYAIYKLRNEKIKTITMHTYYEDDIIKDILVQVQKKKSFFKLFNIKKVKNKDSSIKCPICLESLHKIIKYSCGHQMHKQCARDYTHHNQTTCPICREYLYGEISCHLSNLENLENLYNSNIRLKLEKYLHNGIKVIDLRKTEIDDLKIIKRYIIDKMYK